MNKRVKDSKTIAGGFLHAIGALPANVGEITTRYIKKGVDAVKNIKKKKKNRETPYTKSILTKKPKKMTYLYYKTSTTGNN